MQATLYQFELCPFCHKVKAGLDLKGIKAERVEVNPMNKKELPELPEDAPKKVPVIELDGQLVYDSTTILKLLDETKPEVSPFLPADETKRAKALEIEDWVDDVLTFALPTVIYGTWGEAAKAAQVTARTSNFGFVQNMAVRAGGSMIMHQVAKRILKKHDKTDGRAWMAENLDQIEDWLQDDFLVGPELSLADVAVQGALTCVTEFPVFESIMARPKIAAWYKRVADLRAASAVN